VSPDERGVGPPKEEPGATQDAGPHQQSAHTTDKPKPTTQSRLCSADTVAAQLRRRRAASWRLETLVCGCGPDPLSCACTQPPLSPRWVDAGRDAARHLLEVGHVPLLEPETLRALYRRGGRDRALAIELHELCGQEVA
jgi:hypothetical protein